MNATERTPRAKRLGGLRETAVLILASMLIQAAEAQDWQGVDYIRHSTYQAVNPDGTSAYGIGFPFRLRGVVLNNNEGWLDPTAAYDPGVHLWQLGGQAEVYVQAVDLPEETWDDADFGGTACWMGQNYGNHIWHQDPAFSYTDPQWYAELDRLHLWREGSEVAQLVRAGSLVEVRARAGLYYQGKMNVNERHFPTAENDFEIIVLDPDYGLPDPTTISLAALKDDADAAIFDPSRATGGERFQSTLVEIPNVRLDEGSDWGANTDPTLTDASGHTLDVHLGRNLSFDTQPAPTGWFNVTGILDQKSNSGKDGYRLMVMRAEDISPLPEPFTLELAATESHEVAEDLLMPHGSRYTSEVGDASCGWISVSGNVVLEPGCTLELRPTGASLFTAGKYTLIGLAGAGHITGEFDSVLGLGGYTTGNGLIYAEDALAVQIDIDLNPGDANLDCETDVRDFNVWNAHKFTAGTDWTTGDFNADGETDVRDFNLWNSAKFTSAVAGGAPAPAQVPEPAATTLLICGILALWLTRWRRH